MNVPQTTTAAENTGTNGDNGAFSPDIVAFARAHHAEHCLQPLLEATHRLFPTARFVKVSIKEDPELRNNTQIVFDVQVAGLSLDEVQTARKQWIEAMLSLYRPLRIVLFGLQLELKS